MRLNCNCQTRPVNSLIGLRLSVANKINKDQKPVDRSINSIGLADKSSLIANQTKRSNGTKHNRNSMALIAAICFLPGTLPIKRHIEVELEVFV